MPAPALIGPRPGQPSTATLAFVAGWSRVLTAPRLLGAVWGLTLLIVTVAHRAVGRGIEPWLVAAAGGGVWTLLVGGALDRLAQARPTGIRGFAEACGRYWGRFLRLGALTWPTAAILVLVLQPPDVLGLPPGWWTETTPGGGTSTGRWLAAAACIAGIGLLGVVIDVARVRLVVEDRRSAVAAVSAALRFIRRRMRRVAALVVLHLLAGTLAAVMWHLVAPMTGASRWAVVAYGWAGWLLVVGLRLSFLASLAALFQAELAHRPASPEPLWPDAPAADRSGDLH